MKKHLLTVFLFFIFENLFALNLILEKRPYLFDFGSRSSVVKEYYNRITFDDVYSADKGAGWIKKPAYSFQRDDMLNTTVRDDLTIDGVTGKEIEFKIDIPSGEWYLTYWMEMGYEDKSTTKLKVNGNDKKINLFEFKPGAEGRNKLADVYRVVHTLIRTKENTLNINLRSEQDSIRILGATLIPVINEVEDEFVLLDKIIKESGKYKSKVNLYNLKMKLENLVGGNKLNSYINYWWQQVDGLFEAERLINMMGWEWERYNSASSLFDRLYQAVSLLDAQLENHDISKYPLTDRAQYLRAKLCYDLNLERGIEYAQKLAKQDFSRLYMKYPDDKYIRMFNGELVDVPDYCDNLVYSENAPKWSKLQREAIWRLSSEIDYWVNERQAPNGEWGGKIGDDVELLRWWSPFLLTGNRTAIKGWKNVADAAWNDPKIYKGYSRRPLDVEHASEFISDSTPELIFIDEDSVYFKRLLYTADYFENLWTIVNSKGDRFLRSAWYSSTEVDERPPRNRDVDYNARAVKPLRYLAWYTRDPRYIRLLEEWSMSWVRASLRTDKGKPKGVLPSSIRGYDAAFNGDGHTWYESNMLWNYFDWKFGVGSKILDNILFTYTVTKNDSLLIPFDLQYQLIREYGSDLDKRELVEGSKVWSAKQLINNKFFWELAEKWKVIRNTDEYDDLLLKHGNNYTKYKISKDIKYIELGLEELLENIRYNTPLRTNLVLHTDRVRTPGANHLKAMLIGDGTPEGSSPYYAVTWTNTNPDFTAFVKEAAENSVTIDIFNHNTDVQNVTARFWQLKMGSYNISLTDNDNHILLSDELKINNIGTGMDLKIPSQVLVTLKLKTIE